MIDADLLCGGLPLLLLSDDVRGGLLLSLETVVSLVVELAVLLVMLVLKDLAPCCLYERYRGLTRAQLPD